MPKGRARCANLLELAVRLREERDETSAGRQFVHGVVRGARFVAARSVEYLRQKRDIADGDEKYARSAQRPVHSEIDLVLPAKRLVPRGRSFFAAIPGSERNALDRLDSHAPFRANDGERLEVGRVELVAHL